MNTDTNTNADIIDHMEEGRKWLGEDDFAYWLTDAEVVDAIDAHFPDGWDGFRGIA